MHCGGGKYYNMYAYANPIYPCSGEQRQLLTVVVRSAICFSLDAVAMHDVVKLNAWDFGLIKPSCGSVFIAGCRRSWSKEIYCFAI
eukprot:scaffold375886_cov17-Prasinocladus_malaysianus.AAC.1